MSLNKGDLITKIGLVQAINEKLWEQILATANGVIYHAGNNVTLADEVQKASGTSKISVAALPRFSGTSRTGNQTTSGVVKETNPPAVPAVHLQTLAANSRQKYTVIGADLKATNGELKADTVYNACFAVLQALLHIRPFEAFWTHESTVAGQGWTRKAFATGYRYAVYKDNPVNYNSQIPQKANMTGSGTWGAGGSLSYWVLSRGSNINQLNPATAESVVPRPGCYKDNTMAAGNTTTMLNNFWNAWASRCRAANTFSYNYYSCHLNCHSSCHSSCHGSRSRR